MSDKSLYERLHSINDKGSEKWLSRDLFKEANGDIVTNRVGGSAESGWVDLARKLTDKKVKELPKAGTPEGAKDLLNLNKYGNKEQKDRRDVVNQGVVDRHIQAPRTREQEKAELARQAGITGFTPQEISTQANRTIDQAIQQQTGGGQRGQAGSNNWAELATVAYLHDNSVRSKEDINNIVSELVNSPGEGGFSPFLENLNRGGLRRTDRDINRFLENLHEQNQQFGFSPNPEDIFLRGEGERAASGHPDITERMRELYRILGDSAAHGKDKADIMFKDRDKILGMSIKDSPQEYHWDAFNLNGTRAGNTGILNIASEHENRLVQLAEEQGIEPERLAIALNESRNLMYGQEPHNLPTTQAEYDLWLEENWPIDPNNPKDRRNPGSNKTIKKGAIPPEFGSVYQNRNNDFYTNFEKLLNMPSATGNREDSIHDKFAEGRLNAIFPDDLPYDMLKFNGKDISEMTRDAAGIRDVPVNLRRAGHFSGGEDSSAEDYTGFDDHYTWHRGDETTPFMQSVLRPVTSPFASNRLITGPWDSRHTLRPFPGRE